MLSTIKVLTFKKVFVKYDSNTNRPEYNFVKKTYIFLLFGIALHFLPDFEQKNLNLVTDLLAALCFGISMLYFLYFENK